MKELLSMTIEELKEFAVEIGEKPFRGKQLFVWLHRGSQNVDEMSDLPKTLRARLSSGLERGEFTIGGCRVVDMQEDKNDGTRKFLFEAGGDYIESVFMKYKYGNTLCVSSQVGCRMGCRFCASALGGFARDLSAGEIVGQVLAAERYTGEHINHMVVMGMGEPFDNYENVAKALRLLHNESGKGMSYRNMTVSTSGIIPMIERFAGDFSQVNLAISLHRLDNEGRSEIMPINRKYPVDNLLAAARSYTEKTGRRITFEYTLIRGENDADSDVELMIKRLEGMLCHINLIPLNQVYETGYSGSSRRRAEEIAGILERAGITATVRRELGGEIDGACGQLRLRNAEN